MAYIWLKFVMYLLSLIVRDYLNDNALKCSQVKTLQKIERGSPKLKGML